MSAPVATRASVALIATLAIQVYVSLGATAMSVLAPVIAPEFGLSQKLVGVFVGLVYATAMTASLFSGTFIARYGAIRVSQVAVLLCSLGLALLPIAVWVPAGTALLVIAPLVIGSGYGPITPASSQILARTAPPSRMALTFSIKQTGVPAGAALGGAMLPALTLVLGWRATLLALATAGIVVAFAARPIRADLDRARDPTRNFTIAGTFRPLRRVFASALLTELVIVSFFYAALQVSLMSFLVVYLTEALGWSLVAAGFALAVATVGGVAGRVLWGVLADHYVRPRVLLGLLGVTGGACSLATAAYPASGPVTPLLILVALFGATAIGWNGVQLAEVARLSPPGEAGTITGATGFIGFSGIVVGSPLFGFLAAATGDYRTGFIAFGAAILICGTWVLVRYRRALRESSKG
jgi:MFS family permease